MRGKRTPEGRGEVHPDDLVNADIPLVRRGYDPDRVDPLLERAAATIDRLQALDEPALEQHRRSQADLLHRTLLLAQAGADQQLAQAEATAGALIADAQARASRVVAEAEQVAQQLIEAQSAQARASIGDLLDRRLRLQQELDALERFAADVRGRLRDVFASQATALEHVLADIGRDRPVLREIDLTDPFGKTEPDLAAATLGGSSDEPPQPVTALWLNEARSA